MKFSTDQHIALSTVLDWFGSDPKEACILAGYAGTGKTTLVAHIRQQLHQDNPKLKVAFCSYTGKATQILSRKLAALEAVYGADSVSTIHSLMYSPVRNDEFEIIGWEKQQKLEADLIVVDEASMISKNIWDDLRSYQIPILAVGDHGQLPPIDDSFSLMEHPTVRLEHIHRQAEDHPIIHLSFLARTEGRIPVESFSPEVRKIQKGTRESHRAVTETLKSFHEDMLIVCGYNKTRVRLNQATKKLLAKNASLPESGDQVICLKNNHDEGIFNGMTGTLTEIVSFDALWYQAQVQFPDRPMPYLGLVYKGQFNAEKTLPYEEFLQLDGTGDLFDFGYAMTVHKSQGSQAKEVLLFEERFHSMDDEMWRRWLYTAITRAEEKLTIIGK